MTLLGAAAGATSSFFGIPMPAVAMVVLLLAVVAAAGLGLGSIKVRGVGLGIAGVLFAGIVIGHFADRAGMHVDEDVMHFVREFGLILFVYTIGVQIGPGFFASFRRQGLALNLMAAAIVLLGALMTVGLYYAAFDRAQFPAAVGIFVGATTNTPALGAAQEAMRPHVEALARQDAALAAATRALPGIGYAVAYPFGILGIILAMLIVRMLFLVDVEKESVSAMRSTGAGSDVQTVNLEVTNPNLQGRRIDEIPTLRESGVVISRVMKNGQPAVASPETRLGVGDTVLAVGERERLEAFKLIVGTEAKVDVKKVPSEITTQRAVVTQSSVLGRTVEDLDLYRRFGVTMTRVTRGEVDVTAAPATRMQFGDQVTIVGAPAALQQVSRELGNSLKRLNHPQVIPVFVGIALGVLLGLVPIQLPGVPAPLKLGMAGGPLVVAILMSRLGKIGPVIWHMPTSANFMMRELGIVLFLSVVGLRAGGTFFQTLSEGPGLAWMGYGALITFVPLMIVALVGRALLKVNFVTLCGVLSGSMTDPPALAFAQAVTQGDAASIAYATVYPLTMLMRIFAAQALALFLMSQ